jgi:hypothetical protein
MNLMRNEVVCSNKYFHIAAELSEPMLHIYNHELSEIQTIGFFDSSIPSATRIYKSEIKRKRIDNLDFDGGFRLLEKDGVNKAVNVDFLNDSTICYIGAHFNNNVIWNDVLIFSLDEQGKWKKKSSKQTILNFPIVNSNIIAIDLCGKNYAIGEERLVVLNNNWNEGIQKMEVQMKVYHFDLDHE